MEFILRLTEPEDFADTEFTTREAFWDVYRPGCNEHAALRQIRETDAYIPELDYLAMMDGKIVGHILYSRAKVQNDSGEEELLCFGPVGVIPEYREKGIGSALIRKTMELAKDLGYRAIGIYGNPDYYQKFGFEDARKYKITTPDGSNFDAFMMVELYPGALKGIEGKFIETSAFEVTDEDLEAIEAEFPEKEKLFKE